MAEPRTPHPSHHWLYTHGKLKIVPCEEFVEKFKEFMVEETRNSKNHSTYTLSTERAFYICLLIFTAVVYCLDCGIDIWFKRACVFTTKFVDQRLNAPNATKKMSENIVKLNFKPIDSLTRHIKETLNVANDLYNKFLEEKAERYKAIKKYYKEFYNREDWWTDER